MGVGDAAGLQSLLYFSRARDETIWDMSQIFPEILSISQFNNGERDITGCLLACNGWFMQLLEGPGDNVRSTYKSIERDARHANLQLVALGAAQERCFPLWSMCGRVLSATDQEIVAVLESRSGFDPRGLTADRAIQLLQRIQDLQAKHGQERIVLD